jgi:hypothetical protein
MCASGRLIGLLAAAVIASLLNAPLPSPEHAGSQAATAVHGDTPADTRHAGTYGQLPLHFEHNQGQIDSSVRFLARGSGYSLFLTPDEAVLTLKNRRVSDAAVVRMTLPGGTPAPAVTGRDQFPGKVNYFVGHDPAQWRTNIPTYARVHYRDVYPGIDLAYYGNQGRLEFDFLVAPGADPGRIRMSFEGARDIRIDPDGDLILPVPGGDLRQHAPVVYQDAPGARRQIAARYVMTGEREVGFELGLYDQALPLVIDPILTYGTYLGGDGVDEGTDIAVDADGSVYVTGQTGSTNFPATALAFDTDANGGTDVFVTKLDATGSTLIYSSYLGGTANDVGNGIAVDEAGSAYVTGVTFSFDFPLAGAFDAIRDAQEAFVTKLAPSGSSLVYSSYLGGSGADTANDIAVDAGLSAYITGQTFSGDFPLRGFDTSLGGANDAFVTKLNRAGSGIEYSTYLGGGGTEIGRGIAVDAHFSAHVTGQTLSSDFPTTVDAFDTTLAGGRDAFVTKLDPAGATLVYSTYLGGTSIEDGNDIALDGAGNAHVTGQTSSGTGFPVTPGAVQPQHGGGADAFVTTLDVQGGLLSSTYLGRTGTDNGIAIAVDRGGNASVTGETSSNNFPVTADAVDRTYDGAVDAFVTTLGRAAGSFLFSTYLGGRGRDAGNGIALDAAGSLYVTGFTASADFPVDAAAFDTALEGSQDAFVVKIGAVPAFLTLDPAEDTNPVHSEHCVTATVRDAARNPVSRVTVRFTVIGAVNTRGAAMTDAAGQAVFCYTGPTVTGTDAISAFADTDRDDTQDVDEPDDRAAKTWVAGPPATLTLTPEAAMNPVATQHCVIAAVQDAFGNATPDVAVRFEVTGAVTTGGSATTDLNGQAMYCYTGPTSPGADVIAAFADTDADGGQGVDEPAGSATKTWIPGQPATITLTPAESTNAVGLQHCVTATVRDLFGNATPDIIVRFQVTSAANTSGSATTGANGEAVFCYTGPLVPGADAISAYADTDGDEGWDLEEPIGAVTKTWVVASPATLMLTPEAATNPVATQHCVIAAAKDAFGNATPDVTVQFRVTGAVTTGGSATTDNNGQAGFCYTGPTSPGVDAIAAFADTDADATPDAGEPAGAAAKTWIAGQPATVALTPAESINGVGAQHCVTARVRDRFANATPDSTVRFQVTGAANTSGSATTDASGEATFCYTGPPVPGVDAITAHADTDGDQERDLDEPIGTAAKTWVAGPPATVTLTPQVATNPVGTQHCVSAAVQDAFGNATSGVTVRFQVTGAVNTGASATTGDNGQAVFCYMGPAAPGVDGISAFADTDGDGTQDADEPAGTAAKSWIIGPPATLALTPASAANEVGGQHCVTATVRDAFGNAQPDIAVRFQVTGSVTSSGSATTGSPGEADFCYTGPLLPGSDAISAFADFDRDGRWDAGEPAGAAAKTWVIPASAAACKVMGGGHITTASGSRATFGGIAQSLGGVARGIEGYVDVGHHPWIKVLSTDILAVVCRTATEATVFGRAWVNGVNGVFYRIDLKDRDELGADDTYSIMLSNGYTSGEQALDSGSIQIH